MKIAIRYSKECQAILQIALLSCFIIWDFVRLNLEKNKKASTIWSSLFVFKQILRLLKKHLENCYYSIFKISSFTKL